MHIKILLIIMVIIAITFTTCNAISKTHKTQRSSSITKNRSRSYVRASAHNTRENATVHKIGGKGNAQKPGGNSQKTTTSSSNSVRKTVRNENLHNTNENKNSALDIENNNNRLSELHTSSDSSKQHVQNQILIQHHADNAPSNNQPIYIITNENNKQSSEIDDFAEGYLAGINAVRRRRRRKKTTVAPTISSSTITTTTVSSVKKPCLNAAEISSQDNLSMKQPTQKQLNSDINCEPVSPNPLSLSFLESSSSSPPQLSEVTSVPLAPIQEIIPYNNDY